MAAPVTLMVCVNRRFGPSASCAGRGSEILVERLSNLIAERGLDITLEKSACQGRCAFGPAMRRLPDLEVFLQVTEAELPHIVEACMASPVQKATASDDLPPPI